MKNMISYITIGFFLLIISFSITTVYGINQTESEKIDAQVISLIQESDYETALSIITKALESDPENISNLNNFGGMLITLERYDEAITIFEKILELDSENENALHNGKIAFDGLEFESILDSKYKIFMQIQVHNKNGKLVGVVETDDAIYIPHRITDELIDSMALTDIVEINNIRYEKRVANIEFSSKLPYLSHSEYSRVMFDTPEPVISVLYHAIPLKDDYTITAFSIILRQIS